MIPLNDIRRQLDILGPAIKGAVEEVVSSGRYLFGPRVAAFESEFAAYCGVRHCLTVANGTDAIELALRAVGCGPGCDIITVANAGMYASAAIVAIGATPLLVDIDPATMTIAPEALARAIGPRTKAVVVTHLYGQLADIETLMAIAQHYGLVVIEDCAQAHGARRRGRHAGTWGAIGCFSFYPTKNLGALGDGGAIVTQNDTLAAVVQELRQYGWTSKYRATRSHGRNSRMDEIQAAVLQLKLKHLESGNERRRLIIRRYREAAGSAIVFPDVAGTENAAHLCVARSPARDALRQFLADDGIATDIHYPVPDHRQPAMRGLSSCDLTLAVTEHVVHEIVSLPCFTEMTEAEIEQVCVSLARFCEREAPHKRTLVRP